MLLRHDMEVRLQAVARSEYWKSGACREERAPPVGLGTLGLDSGDNACVCESLIYALWVESVVCDYEVRG